MSSDNTELDEAIERKIYAHAICLKLNVLLANPPNPMPLQCYKRWSFGHMAGRCTSNKLCKRCGIKSSSKESHDNCTNPLKCSNCGSKDHQASDHSNCHFHDKLLKKLIEKGIIGLRSNVSDAVEL